MAQGTGDGQVRHTRLIVMDLKVRIDGCSGFCGGVIRAIDKAERFLETEGGPLYCLGSIVHNEAELRRLGQKGLVTISRDDFQRLAGADVIVRAHGEPPSTYELARAEGINLIDCTCPVVLKLQQRIREAYSRIQGGAGRIVIFGKVGHAEVLGLVGQVNGDATVIEDMDMLEKALERGEIRPDADIELFSQTTKSPSGYARISDELKRRVSGKVTVHNTICSQVASRHEQLAAFASAHDVVVFVSGRESSNGKVLSDLCLSVNPHTYRVGSEDEVRREWFRDGNLVGVCGATSTPKWLLEAVAKKILQLQ